MIEKRKHKITVFIESQRKPTDVLKDLVKDKIDELPSVSVKSLKIKKMKRKKK